MLAEQKPGDQKPGYDEEDVDTYESASWPIQEVIRHHGHHRKGTQSLNVPSPGLRTLRYGPYGLRRTPHLVPQFVSVLS